MIVRSVGANFVSQLDCALPIPNTPIVFLESFGIIRVVEFFSRKENLAHVSDFRGTYALI